MTAGDRAGALRAMVAAEMSRRYGSSMWEAGRDRDALEAVALALLGERDELRAELDAKQAERAEPFLFILGEGTGEVMAVGRALKAAGVPWRWASTAAGCAEAMGSGASCPGDGVTPIRKTREVFEVEDVAAPRGGVRVWLGCRPAGMTWEDLEARGDMVVPPGREELDFVLLAAAAAFRR